MQWLTKGRPLVAVILMMVIVPLIAAGCDALDGGPSTPGGTNKRTGVFELTQDLPEQASVGESFTGKVRVQIVDRVSMAFVALETGQLSVADQGDFDKMNGTTLEGLILDPSVGGTVTFDFRLECPEAGVYEVTAEVEAEQVRTLWTTARVRCTAS